MSASLPAAEPALDGDPYDPDHLLTGYRQSRGRGGYDEFVDEAGQIRPAWRPLAEAIGERGLAGLDRLRAGVRGLVDNDGITYNQVDHHALRRGIDAATAWIPRVWQLDAVPLLVSPADWETLAAGLVQRSRLLDAVLTDLYGPQRCITGGILPPQLLFAHPGYLRAVRGIDIPGRHQLFMHGCDVSRSTDGGFTVNADWTQAPSGAGYALADRRVVAHTVPDLYEQIAPRATSPFAQALRLSLIEAAPEDAGDPMVVVLSPGSHSETAFDQAYLASVLGFPLVESADLTVRDGKLWMRSLGTLKRVDVVLRRVDAAYADPLDLRPESRLGVVGLVEAQRRGAVTVVNSLGSGILESPGLMRFLPKLAHRLLGETPLLDTTPMYWGGSDRERSHLLAHLPSLLIRSTVGADPIVGPLLSAAQRAELAARIDAEPWQWVGQELPQFSAAPTDHFRGGLSPGDVGMRLFTVSQRGGYAPMIGGLGYVLAQDAGSYTLKTVAAKDIWVLPSTRTGAAPAELPTPAAAGTHSVSSPRVLSDLFWTGRYAERAENMARLLTVTRERYHEYRYRQYLDAGACVPVLLSALGRITGTDDEGDDTDRTATAPTTLWSLTADTARPGSLAQSVQRLGLSAQAVRDQMSNDTWMVLTAVDRAVLNQPAEPPDSPVRADAQLATAHARTLSGMLALSGVAAESMVRDAGWTTMDTGRRIERGLWLAALLRATLTEVRGADAEQTITEAVLVACESAVIYRRRNLGTVSIAAVADLLLFDAENPRSLTFQLERLRENLRAMPGSSGSSRPERLLDDIMTRVRRLDPAELEDVDDDGRRAELAGLLDGVESGLRELSEAITTAQLSLPGGMQPLWGPDQRRSLP